MEEEGINVRLRMKEDKAFRKKIAIFTKQKRNELRLTCETCIRQDEDKHELKDLEEYNKVGFVQRSIDQTDNRTGELLGFIYDFVCANGHHISLAVFKHELTKHGFMNGAEVDEPALKKWVTKGERKK